MGKGIETDEKIKVFISSKCGNERYDLVRKELKELIEATGLAKVYLFEKRLATTRSAQQDFLNAVDDSDVCIFLINNAETLPDGVMKEYQRAKALYKKSLFIFCNEERKEPTCIQKELTGADGVKYYVTNSFDEFVSAGYKSLINDIGEVYISYCKNRLIDPEFQDGTSSIKEIGAVAQELLDKQIFENIDKTKLLVANEIYSRVNTKVENTSYLDEGCSEFLEVLFSKKNIKEYNNYPLLASLKKMQSENLHKVVVERWNAIQCFYLDDIKNAIEHENIALNIVRELQLPNWLEQDILIDVRNLYTFEAQSKNQYLFNSAAQEELNFEKSPLFYPLLDRYERRLYQEIIDQSEKSSMRSPYSVTFGNSINIYIDYISSIIIVAVFNGSLTQLLGTFDRIKGVAFQLCSQYSDWEFRVLLLKMALSKGNKKEVEGVSNLFNDVYGKMNSEDAKKIYEFVKGNPIEYQRHIAQLLAFQHLGYYFDDDFYPEVWDEILTIIVNWINSEDRFTGLGDYIFDAISGNLFRLDNDQVIDCILTKVFDCGFIRFYDSALKVISNIDYRQVSKDNVLKINNILICLVKDHDQRKNLYELEHAIISVRKQVPSLCSELHNAVMKMMPEFFHDAYLLEIQTGTEEESKAYIGEYIDQIKYRNEDQGKNGRYSGYADNPYIIIENIIKLNNVKLKKEMISQIIQPCLDTLYAENQTLGAKASAIKLIAFLRLVSEDSTFNFENTIDQLIRDEERIFSGKETLLFDKTSKATLYFNYAMMKLVFNKIEVEEILALLSSYTDLETSEKIEALKTIISIFENGKSDLTDDKVMVLILQFTLGAANDTHHEVRHRATKALLLFISARNKGPIMKKLLSIMDYDSVYIKTQIMNYSDKLKEIDKDSFAFIKEKALVDSHFVIRQRALKL